MTDEMYDIGDRPVVTVEFHEIDTDDLVNPDTILFELKAPDGTITTEDQDDAAHPSLGVYKWELPAAFTASGDWHVKATATNPDTAVEQTLTVRRSVFP